MEEVAVALVYDPAMAVYRFPAGHPMRPERFTLAVELMREWELIETSDRDSVAPGGVPQAVTLLPSRATDEDLLLAHDIAYIEAVKRASSEPRSAEARFGLGAGDTPAFAKMHEAATLAVGGTIMALESVLGGIVSRAFNPAGGLHHAHRSRAAGFCVYNDVAVAIEKATRERDGLRVAYVDVDAHHGDGVEEAFAERADVLTLSVHESGRYLYPGSGPANDIGSGAGRGFTLNVPLPPGAGPECYELVLREIIGPALEAYAPDVIVAQLGADTHLGDPLTDLALTVAGYADVVQSLVAIADDVCGGRLAALGGGGYEPFSVVPRMWACAMARLMRADIPSELPRSWLELSASGAGVAVPVATTTFEEASDGARVLAPSAALLLTQKVVAEVRAVSPLLGTTQL